MTDAQLFSSCSKEISKTPEDINENISVGIPNKQRSCAAVNTPAACVNKAINLIQDLEVKLEESFLQHEILYNLKKLPWDLDAKTVNETEEICLSFSAEGKAEQSLHWKDIQSLKQKTSTVVAEVIELISRLENERKDAEEALAFEKQHRKKLYLNSDKLSFWRLQQLPKAVQKDASLLSNVTSARSSSALPLMLLPSLVIKHLQKQNKTPISREHQRPHSSALSYK